MPGTTSDHQRFGFSRLTPNTVTSTVNHRTDARHRTISINGGRVITPEQEVPDASVVIRDNEIVDIETTPAVEPDWSVDADGRFVLPGFVDLHGDDVESQLEPKTGADIDPEMALIACDRLNLAAGVTTKLNAIAFEELPGGKRSLSRANALLDAIERSTQLLGDHRVHARCEIGDKTAVETVREVIGRPSVDLVSLMHHVPGYGQFRDVESFAREYVSDGRLKEVGAMTLAGRRRADNTAVRGHIQAIVSQAREAGIPVASHDDEDPGWVDELFDLGVDICEYPITLSAAGRADELDIDVAMGAPNLVRGGSLWNNLAAGDAIQAGVVDVLCSDFHPPSLLQSVFVDTGERWSEKVARVSAKPAEAVGLADRGRLEPGYRADIVIVDPTDPPTVERVFVGGTEVYRAGRAGDIAGQSTA